MQAKRVAKVFAGGDHSWCVLGISFAIKIKISPSSMTMSLLPPNSRYSPLIYLNLQNNPKPGQNTLCQNPTQTKSLSLFSQEYNSATNSSILCSKTNSSNTHTPKSRPIYKLSKRLRESISNLLKQTKTDKSMTLKDS